MLATRQEGLVDVEQSFSARDDLLRTLLEDDMLMKRLALVLGPNESSKSVYERQITTANNATNIFMMTVVNDVLTVFNTVVVKDRIKVLGETRAHFRTRMVEEVFRFPKRFPLPPEAFQNLVSSLEQARSTYEEGMDEMESIFLERRYPGMTLSRRIQRIVRLPTSYFRMQILREIKGEVLCLSLFVPFEGVLEPVVYASDDVEFELDYLYQAEQEVGEPAGMYDSALKSISLPTAFQALDLGIGMMTDNGDRPGDDHCGSRW